MESKTFKEIYDSLPTVPPKKAWILRIAEITKASEQTVRMWLIEKRGQRPTALAQSMIAEELGVPAEVLFPKREEE